LCSPAKGLSDKPAIFLGVMFFFNLQVQVVMRHKRLLLLTIRHPDTNGKGDTLILRHRINAFVQEGFFCAVVIVRPSVRFKSTLTTIDCGDGPVQYFELQVGLFDILLTTLILPVYAPIQVRIFSGFFAKRLLERFCKANKLSIGLFYTLRTSFYQGIISKQVLEAIDSLSVNFFSLSSKKKWLVKIGFLIEAVLLKLWEITKLKKYDLVTLVNANEVGRINAKKVMQIANGVEKCSADKLDKRNFTVCLSGNMQYIPNIEAFSVFCKVAEIVIEKRPSIKFRVIGRNADTLPRFNLVTVCSNPEDMYLELGRCTISLCPISSGSGMQNKILEGIATRNFVIASDFALEAFDFAVVSECIRANTITEYAEEIINLYDGNTCRFYHDNFLNDLSWRNGAKLVLENLN